MFDILPHRHDAPLAAPPVLCLSGAMGTTDDWISLSEYLGPRGACRTLADAKELERHLRMAPDGAHIVAGGTAAYHALKLAGDMPERVRSLTLVDPDIIAALPDLIGCPQFHGHSDLIRKVRRLVAEGRTQEAAVKVTDWWMGRRAWSKTAPVIRTDIRAAMPMLVGAWRAQSETPLNLLGLVTLSCPVRIITGRRAPSPIRSLARLLRVVVTDLSVTFVRSARANVHLSDPHVVAPDISNFIVSSDLGWHTRTILPAAA